MHLIKPEIRHYLHRLLAVLTVVTVVTFSVSAADLAREQRLSEQIVDAILDGESVQLTAANHDFLAIETPAESTTEKGAVIILHGRGTHPDWQQVVNPLRTGLPASGWRTLSLQMPVLVKDSKYYDYVPILDQAIPRIEAGIRHLHRQGIKRIVLIAHSCGVHMSMAWIRQCGTRDIDGYIGIGMGATDYRQPMKEPFPFEQVQVPLLNIYGGDDYPAVMRLAGELATQLTTMHPLSTQIEVPGANHYFDDADEELTTVISDWLDKLPNQDTRH